MTPGAKKVILRHFVPAPTITSSASPSVAENATLSHSLTANQIVTWSLVGGADLAKFELNGPSTLRFASNATKDYEAPDDADTNNTYVVTLRARNVLGKTTDQTVTVTVTDVSEATYPLDGLSNVTGAWSFSRDLYTAFIGSTRYDATTGRISTAYDQNGGGLNLTDSGDSNKRPAETTAGPISRVAAQFDTSARGLTGAAISNFITNSAGYIIVSALFDSVVVSGPGLGYGGQTVIGDSGEFMNISCKTNNIYAYNWDGNDDQAEGLATPATNTPYVIEWRHEGGMLYCRVNGGSWSAGTPSGNTQSMTGLFRMGNDTFNDFMRGRIFECATFNVVPNDTIKDALAADFKTWCGA